MTQGRRLIVIGNGPSLRDIQPARFAGVDTIGMNAAYRDWERRGWWPTYYACADHRLALSHIDFFREAAASGRFRRMLLPATVLAEAPELAGHDNVEFIDQYLAYWFEQHGAAAGLVRRHSKFFESIAPSLVTTGAVSLRWGASLGYARIGLIGIDCRYVELPAWRPEADSDLELRMAETPAENPNYFFADYQRKGDLFNVPEPSEHGGNLHLAAIAAVRDDFRAQRLDVSLVNLSESSELSRQGTLLFQPLDDFVATSGISLIVLDYRVRWDLADARAQLAVLGNPDVLPSALADQADTELLMLVPDDTPPKEIAALQLFFDDDFYLAQQFSGLRIAFGEPKAAPRAVLDSFAADRAGFALMLDARALPLRFGWLDALSAVCRAHSGAGALRPESEGGPSPFINLQMDGDGAEAICIPTIVSLESHAAETLDEVRVAFPAAVLALDALWIESGLAPIEVDGWRRASDRLLIIEPVQVPGEGDPWRFGPGGPPRTSIGLRILGDAFRAGDEIAVTLAYAAVGGWLSTEIRAEDTAARIAISEPFEALGVGRHLFRHGLDAPLGALRIRIQLAEAPAPEDFDPIVRLDWIDVTCHRNGTMLGHARIDRQRRPDDGDLARSIGTIVAESRTFLPDGGSSFRHEITVFTEDDEPEHCALRHGAGELVVAVGPRMTTIASHPTSRDEDGRSRFAIAIERLARTHAAAQD